MRRITRITLRSACAVLTAALFVPHSSAGAGPRPKANLAQQTRGKAHIHDNRYEFVTFSIPGAPVVWAVDVNSRGMVAGVADDGLGNEVTWVWQRGTIEYISYPGAPITNAPAITNTGLLGGNWGTNESQTAGWFDLKSRLWTELPAYPGKNLNFLWRVNAAGIAVGQACEGTFFAPENCVGWLWDGNTYHILAAPNAVETVPANINERGQVVGYARGPQIGQEAFLYEDGHFTFLHPNGSGPSVALDITNSGQITVGLGPGFWGDTPAIYDRGVVSLLPLYPDSLLTIYQGINERGDLAGAFITAEGAVMPLIALKK